MQTSKHTWDDIKVTIEISVSATATATMQECHVIVHVKPISDTFTQQYSRLNEAMLRLMELPEMQGFTPVFKRYFLSDAANQYPVMPKEEQCATGYIQQPPLDGSKIALWAYLMKGVDAQFVDGNTIVERNGYKQLWTASLMGHNATSAVQTDNILNNYANILDKHNANIKDNCLRTWFFVRDVDTQYKGMIKARKDFFALNGLSDQTHYIASTGIGGIPPCTDSIVQMDAYSVIGIPTSAITYIKAPTHFIAASSYGATFERATLVDYQDHKHIYVSGTASIDNKGDVVHIGDIEKQTYKMWENVEALLQEGDMDLSNIMHAIVYLRDTADYPLVSRLFAERFPNTPCIITLAPVCRPTWLIEMECVAVK